jgi:hypothetical protein
MTLEGDLNISGNIVIDGGIVDPDGNPSGGGNYAVAIADTPPENGKSGDTWFDSTEGEGSLYIHDGDVWFSSNAFSKGSSGAGMVIQPTEPTDPVTGLQWMDSATGRIWIWDDNKWLEFPAGGGSGGIEDAPEDGVQYARQDGSWSAVEGGGGGWELLATVEAVAGSSSVELNQITDEFDDYKIIVSDVVSSDPRIFNMQIAIDGSYKTSGYGFHCNHTTTISEYYAGKFGNDSSAFTLLDQLDPTSAILNSIEISAFGANNPAGAKTFLWHGMCYHHNKGILSMGGGYQADVGKLTGIRFLMNLYSIEKGTFKLYGIKK